MVKNSNVVAISNLQVLSNISTNSLSYKGSNVLDIDGLIDYKYLKNAPIMNSNGQLSTAGIILGTLGVVTAAGVGILTQAGKTGPALQDDILNRLGNNATDDTYDPNQQADQNLFTHWNNIVFPPIYQNIGKQEIGIGSNLYIAGGSAIYSIDKNNLVAYDSGRTKRIANNPTGLNLIYDTATATSVSKYILCSSNASIGTLLSVPTILTSNITTSNLTNNYNIQTSNLTASNINVSTNISTSNVSSSQVQVGNFYITSNGVYIGNPSNPFTTFQVIDASGNYKGTVNKEQVINTEALNFTSMGDGVVQWSGFQSATINPLFTNPFTFDLNSMFEVL
jgi:hypothetical protein